MNKKIFFAVGAVVVVGIWLFFAQSGADRKYEPAAVPENGSTTQLAASSTYTAVEVATHKDDASCWSIINGNVYDLTTWIPNHPGGADKIRAICGKDGSAAFNAKHSESEKALQTLPRFLLGGLAE